MDYVSIIFSVLAFAFASIALIEIKAMQRSTHKISFFDPKSQEFSSGLNDEQKKVMTEEPYDNF